MAGDVDKDTDTGDSNKLLDNGSDKDDGPGTEYSTVLRDPAGDPSTDIIG